MWMFQKMKTSLRTKISVYFIIVVIIPVSILGGYAVYRSREDLLNEKEESYKSRLMDKVYQIEKWANSIVYMGDSLRFNQQLEKFLTNQIPSKYDVWNSLVNNLEPVLNMMMTSHKDIAGVTVYTSEDAFEYGKFFIHLSSIEDKPYYPILKDQINNLWVIDGQQLRYYHNLYTVFNKSRDNYVCFVIPLSAFEEIIGLDETQSSVTILTKADHSILYSSNTALIGDDNNILSMRDTHQYFSESIDDIGWTLYYLVDKKMYNSDNNILFVVLLVLFASFIFIGIIISNISRKLVAPINGLIHKMKDVEEGNLKVFIENHSQDEIGVLTHQFNTMTYRINHLIEEVYKSKLTQKEAELSALQARINPHFLYNSLAVVSWMAIFNEQDEISDVLESLVTFYKTTLNNGTQFTSIENELSNIKAYLDIQLIIKDYGFDVNWDIDQHIYDHCCVNLSLQPIVENALEHGIKNLEDRKGVIRISGKILEDNIVLTVEDNGVGMAKEIAKNILIENTKGYGVKNVYERNKLYYGDAFKMNVTSEINKGTLISLSFPKQTN